MLLLGTHRPLHLTQRGQLAQARQPVIQRRGSSRLRRANQPHQLPVQPLAKAARQFIRHTRQLLLGQQCQHAAVNLAARQDNHQRGHQQQANEQPALRQPAVKIRRQSEPAPPGSASPVGSAD
ncbi:hypothetical protein ACVW1M_002211 [Ewingella americana]